MHIHPLRKETQMFNTKKKTQSPSSSGQANAKSTTIKAASPAPPSTVAPMNRPAQKPMATPAKPEVATPSTTKTTMEAKPTPREITTQQVAEAAYFLWLRRGGNETVNWLEAENLLKSGRKID
jgi:hypothetical protein